MGNFSNNWKWDKNWNAETREYEIIVVLLTQSKAEVQKAKKNELNQWKRDMFISKKTTANHLYLYAGWSVKKLMERELSQKGEI